eukprot:Rmarinus@m.19699
MEDRRKKAAALLGCGFSSFSGPSDVGAGSSFAYESPAFPAPPPTVNAVALVPEKRKKAIDYFSESEASEDSAQETVDRIRKKRKKEKSEKKGKKEKKKDRKARKEKKEARKEP